MFNIDNKLIVVVIAIVIGIALNFVIAYFAEPLKDYIGNIGYMVVRALPIILALVITYYAYAIRKK